MRITGVGRRIEDNNDLVPNVDTLVVVVVRFGRGNSESCEHDLSGRNIRIRRITERHPVDAGFHLVLARLIGGNDSKRIVRPEIYTGDVWKRLKETIRPLTWFELR